MAEIYAIDCFLLSYLLKLSTKSIAHSKYMVGQSTAPLYTASAHTYVPRVIYIDAGSPYHIRILHISWYNCGTLRHCIINYIKL